MLEALRQPGANRRGTKGDKALSETTLQHTLGVLRTAVAWAVRQRLISHNPADDVYRPQRVDKEMRTWSADELARFLDRVGCGSAAPAVPARGVHRDATVRAPGAPLA